MEKRDEKNSPWKTAGLLAFGAAIGAAGLAIYQGLQESAEERADSYRTEQPMRAQQTRADLAPPQRPCRPEGDPKDDRFCVVCLDNVKEIMLVPCGHVCLCRACSGRIRGKCPVCQSNVADRIRAFI